VKNLFFFLIIFFITLKIVIAEKSFAPIADNKPILVYAINDAGGEVDLKWSTLRSDADAGQTGISTVKYLVFRKEGTYFSNLDINTLYNEGIVIDTISQTVTFGIPDYSFIYWSDNNTNNLNASKLLNGYYYTYTIVAFDISDSQYSLPSDTKTVYVDTAGPIIIELYNTPPNYSPVSRNNIIITIKLLEDDGLSSENLYFHFGFNNNPNSFIFNIFDTVPMTIVYDTPYYYASAILPLANIGSNTIARFYISGRDNINGSSEEPSDSSIDGNVLTSNLSDSNLLDWNNSYIYYLDEEPPRIILANLIDSGIFVRKNDTYIYVYLQENVAIDTTKLYLVAKSKITGQIETGAISIIANSGDSYYISALLPLSRFADNDEIVYYLTGTDKGGNNISSYISPIFISEQTEMLIRIDEVPPYILSLSILNNNNTPDLTYSTNEYADSIYKIIAVINDSTQITNVYLKFYSSADFTTDLTNYVSGSETLQLINQYNGDTYWLLSDTIFLNDTEIFPVIYANDTLGNLTIYGDINFNSATQNYLANQYNIKIFSDTLRIIGYSHINNNYNNSNTIFSIGDTINFYFSSKIETTSFTNVNDIFLTISGNTFGINPIYSWFDNYTKIAIQLTNGFTITSNETVYLNTSLRDVYGNISELSEILNFYETARPRIIAVYFQNADTYTTYINAGDSFIVEFSEIMDTSILPDGNYTNLNDTIVLDNNKSIGSNINIVWLENNKLLFSVGNNFNFSDGDTFYINGLKDINQNEIDTTIHLILYDTEPVYPINVFVNHNLDSTNRIITLEFSETIYIETIQTNIINSSKSIDTIYYNDSRSLNINFLDSLIPLSDTIAITNLIKDNSLLKNSATYFEEILITDIDSPYIVTLYFLNNDTNQLNTSISSGDSLIIIFSEPIKDTETFNSSNISDSILIVGAGDTYGNNPVLYWRNNNILEIGLDVGVNIVNNDGLQMHTSIFDLVGHFNTTSETKIVLDNVGPVLKNVYIINNDTNTTFSPGDSIVFQFSEPIKQFLINEINDNIKLPNGRTFGTITEYNYYDNNETLIITIPENYYFLPNDTIYLTQLLCDTYNNPAISSYSQILYDSISPHLLSIEFINNDTIYTSFNSGDSIVFIFSERMDTGLITLSSFYFSNPTDTYGNATLVKNSDSMITIKLGAGAFINNGDSIIISPQVKDIYGNTISINYGYVIDNAQPLISSIIFTDNDTSSTISEGDTFTIIFSEEMDTSILVNGIYADLNDTILISENRNLGSNVLLYWLTSNKLEIRVGTNFTCRHNDTHSFKITSLTDANNNSINLNSYGYLQDTAGPIIELVFLNADYDSRLRTIDVLFNVPIATYEIQIDSFIVNNRNPINLTILSDTEIRLNFDFSINIKTYNFNLTSNKIKDLNNANVQLFNLPQNIIDTKIVDVLMAEVMPSGSNDTFSQTLKIYFNKIINYDLAINPANYQVNNNITNIIYSSDSLSVIIRLSNLFNIRNDTIVILQISDYAETNIANNIIIETSQMYDFQAPYITSVNVINNDSNTDLSAGDTIIISFSEIMNTSPITENNLDSYFILSNNHQFNNAQKIVWSDTYTGLWIQLGSNFTIQYNDSIRGTNNLTDLGGNSDTTIAGSIIITDIYKPDTITNLIHQDINEPIANNGYDNDTQINFSWQHSISTDTAYYKIYVDTVGGLKYYDTTIYNFINVQVSNQANTIIIAITTVDRSNLISDTVYSNEIKIDTIVLPPVTFIHSDSVFNIFYDTDTITNLSWTESQTDIDYYELYVDSGNGFIYIDTTTLNNYSYSNCEHNIAYQFGIIAIDLAGNRSDTKYTITIICDTGDVLKPNKPYHYDSDTNLKANFDNDTIITFRWQALNMADLLWYAVYVSIDNSEFIFYDTTLSNDTDIDIIGDFKTDSTVQIKIMAYDNAGNNGEFSDVSELVKIDRNYPFITNIEIINNDDTNTDISAYDTMIIYFSEAIDSSGISAATIDTYFSFSGNHKIKTNITIYWEFDTKLVIYFLDDNFTIRYGDTITGTYYLRDLAGNYDTTIPGSVIIYDTYPPTPVVNLYHNDVNAPSANSGYDNDNYANFFWTNSYSTDRHHNEIYVDTGAGYVFKDTTTANSYNVLIDNKTSTVAIGVRTVDNFNYKSDTTYSDIIKIDTIIIAPGQPIHSDSVFNVYYDTDTIINIVWSDSQTDIVYYQVDVDAGPGYVYAGTTIEKNYTYTNAINGKSYRFRVKAIDLAGNVSSYSSSSIWITVDTGGVPQISKPYHSDENTYLTLAYDNDTNIRFNWQSAGISDLLYYEVYYSIDSSVFEFYNTTPNTYIIITRSDLKSDSYVKIKVRARDNAGNYGELSEESDSIIIDTGVGRSTLLSPENNNETNNVRPIFRWNLVSDAKYYVLTIATNSQFTNIYLQDTVQYIDYYILSDSLNAGSSGVTYYWRITTIDTAGNYDSTTYNKFIIDTYIATPTIINPENWSETNNYRPLFKWTEINKLYNKFYLYEITAAGDTDLIITIDTTVSSLYLPTYFTKSGTYAFQIISIDTATNISTSPVSYFVIKGINKFNLISPINNTDTNNNNPLFIWENTYGDSIVYRFEFSSRETFDSGYVYYKIVNDTFIYLYDVLGQYIDTEDTFYWRVVAIDSNNFSLTSNQYHLIRFDFTAIIPQVFNPPNNQKLNDTTIEFSCNNVLELVEYKFEFCSDTLFSQASIFLDTIISTTNSCTYAGLKESTFYWRIIVKDYLGNTGISNVNKFEIDTYVNATLVGLVQGIVYDDLGIYTSDKTPTFEWQLKSDVTNYNFQLSRQQTFQQLVFSETTTMKEITIPEANQLIIEDTYYYRVITTDDYGNYNISNIGYFVLDYSKPLITIVMDSMVNTNNETITIYVREKNFYYLMINNDTKTNYVITQLSSDSIKIEINLLLPELENYFELKIVDRALNTETSSFSIFVVVQQTISDSQIVNIGLLGDTPILIHKTNNEEINFTVKINNKAGDYDTIAIKLNLDNDYRSAAPEYYKNDIYVQVEKTDTNLIHNSNKDYFPDLSDINYISFKILKFQNGSFIDLSDLFSIDSGFLISFELKYIFDESTKKPTEYGIYYLNLIDTKWYEITNAAQPGGQVIKIGKNYEYGYENGKPYIKAEMRHLSNYAIALRRLLRATSVNNIIIYPNPFIPEDGNLMTGKPFDRGTEEGGIYLGIDTNNDNIIDRSLPDNVDIKIYNIIGELVRTNIYRASDGLYIWDGKNNNNEDVASGIYFVVIKYNGNTIVKKVGIIR